MELKKPQKDAIVRKLVAQLIERNNEEINKLAQKVDKATKLTSQEAKTAIEQTRKYKVSREQDKAISKAGLSRYPNYVTKVSDAIELSSVDSEDLNSLLIELSKQFKVDFK